MPIRPLLVFVFVGFGCSSTESVPGPLTEAGQADIRDALSDAVVDDGACDSIPAATACAELRAAICTQDVTCCTAGSTPSTPKCSPKCWDGEVNSCTSGGCMARRYGKDKDCTDVSLDGRRVCRSLLKACTDRIAAAGCAVDGSGMNYPGAFGSATSPCTEVVEITFPGSR